MVASTQGIQSALKALLLLPFKFILPNQLGKYVSVIPQLHSNK